MVTFPMACVNSAAEVLSQARWRPLCGHYSRRRADILQGDHMQCEMYVKQALSYVLVNLRSLLLEWAGAIDLPALKLFVQCCS